MVTQRKIGILGGTFNPVHIGHLVMAEVARQECNLDKVIFIPTGDPPHKVGQYVELSEHRLKMVELAVSDNPFFEVDDLEIRRSGITYTIDTLLEYRARAASDVQLYFIIGGDTLMEITSWRRFEEVLKLCSFAVYQRPGYMRKEIEHQANYLRLHMGASIFFVEGPALDISSTEIRQRLKQRKTVKYLLPSQVDEYIHKHSLYMGE